MTGDNGYRLDATGEIVAPEARDEEPRDLGPAAR